MSYAHKIIWTTPAMLKKAIKGAYLDYFGEQISDECVKRIIRYVKELRDDRSNYERR